ncbi:IgGFc-binding protein-like [Leptodactylus fuscus]|uniref:IgGFc-binding protein-like n=1 Tax=Leptodactylus fuscus TaxID=238119 RepID=UPI003F4E95EF
MAEAALHQALDALSHLIEVAHCMELVKQQIISDLTICIYVFLKVKRYMESEKQQVESSMALVKWQVGSIANFTRFILVDNLDCLPLAVGSGMRNTTLGGIFQGIGEAVGGFNHELSLGGILHGTGETPGKSSLQVGENFTQNVFGWRKRTTQGRYFLAAFMHNSFSTEIPLREILVTGISPSTSVTISINKSNFKKEVKVGKGETVTIQLPRSRERTGSGICPCSTIIKADADITVMSRSFKGTSGDVALMYPVDQWGKDHYIVTPFIKSSDHYTEFGVLAQEFPTTVTMVLSTSLLFNEKYYRKGKTLTVNLEPFQFLQIQSKDDLSGTRINSQHPVAVLSGHSCAPSKVGCSHVYEQLQPVEHWGTSYFVPCLSLQPTYDIVYVFSSKSTFFEYQSGGKRVKGKAEAGQLMTLKVSASSPLSIHSEERIQVLFYGTGGKTQGMPFGSFLTKIPDIESFSLTYNLIGQKGFDNNLALIIAKTSSGPEITYNGKGLRNTKWNVFAQSEYSWSEYYYGGGFSSNTVQHGTTPFGLLIIGFSRNMAYGSVAPGIEDVAPND